MEIVVTIDAVLIAAAVGVVIYDYHQCKTGHYRQTALLPIASMLTALAAAIASVANYYLRQNVRIE